MKMKYLTKAPLLVMCAFTTQMAQAVTSADLSLAGRIMPTACDISVENNGVWHQGWIGINDLESAGVTVLPMNPPRRVSITCSSDTLSALRLTDNRDGTSASDIPAPGHPGFHPERNYGLGLFDNKPVGYVLFQTHAPNRALVDGVYRDILRTFNAGTTWTAGGGGAFEKNQNFFISWGDASSPIAGRSVTFDLYADVGITDKSNLPAGEIIPFDGSATLELIYL
jgi:type 1 fimbria pilin